MVKSVPKSIITELVLDVLKPSEPSIIELSKALGKYKNIKNVQIEVFDVDQKTEKISIIVQGKDLDYLKIKDIIEKQSAAVHSIDGVIVENK